MHYYNDGVLSGFVEEHLACRISTLGTRKKRVPWIPSAVFSGKYTARISSRDATYENYLSARLFRASRESRKVRRPGVFIFSTALQIRAASLLSEFIIKRAYTASIRVKREPVRAYVADKQYLCTRVVIIRFSKMNLFSGRFRCFRSAGRESRKINSRKRGRIFTHEKSVQLKI